MGKAELPQFPYGSVYFRKSNPPEADWERDYAVAREDGMNTFRHWFMWGAIETFPGVYDWADYDRQLELAAKHGIKTVIAEMVASVPEWLPHAWPDAVYAYADGSRTKTRMGPSSATGGFGDGSSGVLCLDHPQAREMAGRFIKELVLRYKDHESVIGYDIWNECNYSPDVCYCSHTKEKFRVWLKRKYGGLDELNVAWRRYSYTDWAQVEPPAAQAPYPECADWLSFKKENFYEQMKWRAELIRSLDGRNWIIAHGVAGSVNQSASGGADDWMAASRAEIYGFTWVASRKGNEPWKQWHAVDIVRAASRGKPFWHAEAQGGPLWLQPQTVGRARQDGRVAEPEDIRLWQMISFAGGARGLMFPRWRPLLDGPLFGAFGPYAMDGSRTDRSEMASRIAKWANSEERKELWNAVPVRGDIGILVMPETQIFDYLLQKEGRNEFYAHSLWGAYQGFFDNNIQADWVRIEEIDEYRAVYVPYPVMMPQAAAERLKDWVRRGGMLVSEGCPAYFGEGGRVGTRQPNYGMDDLFGATEETVEFMPDISGGLTFGWNGERVHGGLYRQSYRTAGGTVAGRYGSGSPAVVEHAYGKGKTLLVGTFPSEAYYRERSSANRGFFAGMLEWAGLVPHARISNRGMQARLSEHPDGDIALWIVNPQAEPAEATVELADRGVSWKAVRACWGTAGYEQEGRLLRVNVPGKDALALWLERKA